MPVKHWKMECGSSLLTATVFFFTVLQRYSTNFYARYAIERIEKRNVCLNLRQRQLANIPAAYALTAFLLCCCCALVRKCVCVCDIGDHAFDP